METIFIILAVIIGILTIPVSLYFSIMAAADNGILKGVLIFLGITFLVSLIPISITYFLLSIVEWLIDVCRESHQTLLVSGLGIILILKGLRAKGEDLSYLPLKLILKLLYIASGIILMWYGFNYGYGELSWKSLLIFTIISIILEATVYLLNWKKEGGKLTKWKDYFTNNCEDEGDLQLSEEIEDEVIE